MNVGWDGRGDLALNTGPLSLPLTRESWSHLKWRAGSRGGEGGRGGEGTEAWAVAAVGRACRGPGPGTLRSAPGC